MSRINASDPVTMCRPSDSTIQQRGRIYKSRRGLDTRTKPHLLFPRHLVQIYDVQLQTRMLTAFPISLSWALVVVPSKGYLASQQWCNQFMGPPRKLETKTSAALLFCFPVPLPKTGN